MSDKPFRSFTRLSKAWYAEANLKNHGDTYEIIDFGLSHPDGGCVFEIAAEWNNIGCFIRVWDDSFRALHEFSDVFNKLSTEPKGITPDKFCETLLECGFKDDTPTKDLR